MNKDWRVEWNILTRKLWGKNKQAIQDVDEEIIAFIESIEREARADEREMIKADAVAIQKDVNKLPVMIEDIAKQAANFGAKQALESVRGEIRMKKGNWTEDTSEGMRLNLGYDIAIRELLTLLDTKIQELS